MDNPKYTITERKISDYRPAEINPNAGTERGIPDIENSLNYNGFGRPLNADKDDEMIAGSHTLQAAENTQIRDVVEIATHGDVLIVHKRLDLDLTSDPRARALQIADNKTTITGYNQDDELLGAILVNLAADDEQWVRAAGFNQWEIENLLRAAEAPDDPYAHWQGMPEFDPQGLAYRSLHIHFRSQEDVDAFAQLIEQIITDKTASLWYPPKERQDRLSMGYISDES